MKVIHREIFNALMKVAQVPCVSIYLPVHPLDREGMSDRLRWEQALNSAKDQLLVRGWSKQPLEEMFAAAFAFPNTPAWGARQNTLALFLAPNVHHCWSLETEIPEETWGDDRFHVRPLLPLMVESDAFYLLTISEHRVHLYAGDAETLQLCEVPQLPENVNQVLDIEYADRGSQVHSGGQAQFGKAGAVYHGHGGVKDTADANLDQYVHQIAKSVDHYLQGKHAPLLLMAVENLVSRWSHHSRYAHFSQPVVHGSADHLTLSQIHAKAWDAVQDALRTEQMEAWKKYEDLRATPRTAMGLHQVLNAAHAGRIDTLFLDCARPVWGRFDCENATANIHHAPQHGDRDLLEEALVATIQHGGQAFSLKPDAADRQELTVAMLRY